MENAPKGRKPIWPFATRCMFSMNLSCHLTSEWLPLVKEFDSLGLLSPVHPRRRFDNRSDNGRSFCPGSAAQAKRRSRNHAVPILVLQKHPQIGPLVHADPKFNEQPERGATAIILHMFQT